MDELAIVPVTSSAGSLCDIRPDAVSRPNELLSDRVSGERRPGIDDFPNSIGNTLCEPIYV
jgi:hypothetical protein